MNVLYKLFESDFMPHGHCYYWEPEIVWAYAVSDSIIAVAYFTIPLSIGYIVKARRDFKYYWLLILFAVFILGCGATHVMDVLNIWHPFYRFDSVIRVITAIASIGTAIMLVKITPQILLIPNADTFKKLNKELQDQILLLQQTEEELKAAQEDLAMANEELENKVEGRTKELSIANEKLLLSNKELEATDVKLKENEELFRTMVNSIPNLAWMANPDGSIFWCNRRWYEYTGTTAEDMEGWGWKSVHDPNLIDKIVENWNRSIMSGEPFEMIFPLKGVDGNFRQFLTRVMPIKDSHGKVKRWLGTNTDITEIKKAEERLEMQNEELLKINKDLDNFIYTASHDLKAPIMNIEGLITVIQSLVKPETKSNEEFQQIILMIQSPLKILKEQLKI